MQSFGRSYQKYTWRETGREGGGRLVTHGCPHLPHTLGVCPGHAVWALICGFCPQWGFPGGEVVKNPLANAGDVGMIPGSGRSPGEGNGNPLHYSSLENFVDRGGSRATVRGLQLNMT